MTGSIGSAHHPTPPEPHKTPNPAYDRWMQDKDKHVKDMTDLYMMHNMGRMPTEGQQMMWREQFEQDHPKPPPYLLG